MWNLKKLKLLKASIQILQMSFLSPEVCFHMYFHSILCYELFVTNHTHIKLCPIFVARSVHFHMSSHSDFIENFLSQTSHVHRLVWILISETFLLFTFLLDSYFDLDASFASVLSEEGLRPLSFFPLFRNSFLVFIPSLTLSSLNSSCWFGCIFLCFFKGILVTNHAYVDQTLVILTNVEPQPTFTSECLFKYTAGIFPLSGSVFLYVFS